MNTFSLFLLSFPFLSPCPPSLDSVCIILSTSIIQPSPWWKAFALFICFLSTHYYSASGKAPPYLLGKPFLPQCSCGLGGNISQNQVRTPTWAYGKRFLHSPYPFWLVQNRHVTPFGPMKVKLSIFVELFRREKSSLLLDSEWYRHELEDLGRHLPTSEKS